jgi:Flp pilus assembly protein TadD
MNRFSALALLLVLSFAGCKDAAKTASDDAGRLEKIDRKFNDGDFEYTVRESMNYVQTYPRSFKGWGLLGWAYVKTDQLDKAQESFDKSLTLNPKWDNAYVGKGAMYRKKGENGNARKSYLKAIELLPENAEAYSSLLVIELLEKNNKRAVEYGEKAWALRKDSPTIPANLAVAYHYLGDKSKRDQFYEHAARLGYHRLESLKDIFDGKTSL